MESKETLNKLIQTEGIESVKKMIDEITTVDNQQSAKDWLIDQIDGLIIDIKLNPHYIIYKKENIYFWYDPKNHNLFVSYHKIWRVLRSKFQLNDQKIIDLCQVTVGDTMKIRVNTIKTIKSGVITVL